MTHETWRFERVAVASAIALVCLSMSLVVRAAAMPGVEANKAVVKRYLEAEGTVGFAKVQRSVQARDHRQLRYEFHNLKYNADNSELAARAQPDYKALVDRSNTITRLLGDGDMVGALVHVKGTHKGNLYGIPASGKTLEFDEVAIFKLAKGRIVETWLMADEAAILRQLGTGLPARQDGRLIAPPVLDDSRVGDVVLKELEAHPVDSQQYRNKLLMVAYKAKTKPAWYTFGTNRAYADPALRSGNQNTVDMIKEIKAKTGKDVPGSFGAAWSGREDMIANVITEGNSGIMQFRLNALNAGPLYTIPASNKQIRSWEVCFAEFVDGKWQKASWFGDEVGMLLQIGGQEAQSFLFGDGAMPK